MPLCWICNKEPGTTGEHRLKRSDIKEQLGDNVPLHFHTDARRNLKLQSSNAKRLKFEPSICNSCNSARTQPHDFAWQRLSAALRERKPPLKTGDIIRANRIFPCMTSAEMRNVHLFFCKVAWMRNCRKLHSYSTANRNAFKGNHGRKAAPEYMAGIRRRATRRGLGRSFCHRRRIFYWRGEARLHLPNL